MMILLVEMFMMIPLYPFMVYDDPFMFIQDYSFHMLHGCTYYATRWLVATKMGLWNLVIGWTCLFLATEKWDTY